METKEPIDSIDFGYRILMDSLGISGFATVQLIRALGTCHILSP